MFRSIKSSFLYSLDSQIGTILIALTIIIQEWGYNINGLIAGFGLGGLAIAMAAQESLANIFEV